MKVAEFKAKKIFSEASGSCAVVDDNIKMNLNEYGIYEEIVLLDEDDELDQLLNMSLQILIAMQTKQRYPKIYMEISRIFNMMRELVILNHCMRVM